MRLAPTTNQLQGRALAAKQAKRLHRDRMRAGASMGSGNGQSASKRQKWNDFEDLQPMPDPIVVR